MTLKHTILTAIIAVLTAALFFCFGMHYTLEHMEIETDGYGDTALITLNDNVYMHGINGYPLD